MIGFIFRHRSARGVIASILIVAVIMLGAAAKRSQFPSSNPTSSYLAKAVKMAEVRIHHTGVAVLLPAPSSQSVTSIAVPASPVLPGFWKQEKPLRIELQSPPLLV